jgi:hypothetical protein
LVKSYTARKFFLQWIQHEWQGGHRRHSRHRRRPALKKPKKNSGKLANPVQQFNHRETPPHQCNNQQPRNSHNNNNTARHMTTTRQHYPSLLASNANESDDFNGFKCETCNQVIYF